MVSSDDLVTSGNVRWSIGLWAAVLVASGLAVSGQSSDWLATKETPEVGWWSGLSPDWLPFLPVLVCSVPLWFVRRSVVTRAPRWWSRLRGWGAETCPTPQRPVGRREERRAILLSLLVAIAGLLMSQHVSRQFGNLPPAYHDEYSYLFQAETFLAGRTSFPSHPQMPKLFDQVHVLNEGYFASRYFPGVGAWIAPFLALGHPLWGHHFAHAFACLLLFWIGRHLRNNAVGLLAGLLLVVSPGVALFSDLLLSHHPTLVALLVFVITFLKLTRAIDEGTKTWHWATLSGCGLTYAMVCRPMTAAGVGLPFGLWFLWWAWTGRDVSQRDEQAAIVDANRRLKTVIALGVPLLVGGAGLFAYNFSITGNGFLTPYQQYTEIYTPRHVYGFNNVKRGEQHLGPKVLEHYDQWAENLTPALAAKNVGRRVTASLRWTLGIVPLSIVAIIFLATIDLWARDWLLMAAAIVSLHAVHVPYWFEGIMGWHYVFESALFWLLLFAGVSERLWRHWSMLERPGMPVWWTSLVVVSIVVNLVTVPPLWPARLDVGVVEVSFSRQRYADFARQVEQLIAGRRSLVLVEADPSDRHIDYVVNHPRLDSEVLFGRYRPGETDLSQVVSAFPDRDVFLVRLLSRDVELLSRGASGGQ
jgi:hypothetical protein